MRPASKTQLLVAAVVMLPIAGWQIREEERPALDPRPPVMKDELLDGDLVFRRGRDVLARVVLGQGDDAQYSHVGMVVGMEGEPFVVHAIPFGRDGRGGVVLERLSEFTAQDVASAVSYYRVDRIAQHQRSAMRRFALARVGTQFDDDFLLTDDQRIYCSELIIRALAASDIDIMPTAVATRLALLREDVVLPDDLRRSPMLRMLVRY